jgi:hypothetical protein
VSSQELSDGVRKVRLTLHVSSNTSVLLPIVTLFVDLLHRLRYSLRKVFMIEVPFQY